MPAKGDQQLRLLVENLHAILLPIGHPDVAIGVNRHSLGTSEISGAVSRLAEGADELAVGVEDLDAVVQGIANVQIAIRVDRDARRFRKVARRGELVIMSGSTDLAQQLETICVIDQYLVQSHIGYIEQTVFFIDRHRAGLDHPTLDDIYRLVIRVEYQDMAQAWIRDE